MTIDAFIAQAKAKHAAMTQGRWTTKKPGKTPDGWPDATIVAATGRGQGIFSDTNGGTFPAADQDGIVHLHNTFPILLAIVERQQDALRTMDKLGSQVAFCALADVEAIVAKGQPE